MGICPAQDSVQTLGMTAAMTRGKVVSPLLPPNSAAVLYAGQNNVK